MDLRGVMFRKLLTLPARYYDDQASGNLISKLTFDVMQVTTAATSVLTAVFKDALVIVGLLAWLLWLNWKLTLLALAMTPVIVLVVRVISVRLRRTSREVQTQMGDMTQVIQETIEGHRVVKLFGGQDYEQRRFDAQANNVRRQLMKQVAASAASVPIVQFLAALALAIIVYLATQQSNAEQITVGGFVSFITAMLMLIAPLKRVTSVNEPLQRGLAAAESVFALIDQDERARYRHRAIRVARAARSASSRCALPTAPTAAMRSTGIDLAIAPGRNRGAGRRLRQRQDHAGQPGAALLPADGRPHTARRPGHCRPAARRPARQHRAGQPGRGAVQRHRGGQHRLRRHEPGGAGRHHRGRGGRACDGVHPRDAARG